MNDHDLLIQLCERVEMIHVLLSNHLEHHFWFNVTLLGIIGGLVTALILMTVKKK